MADSSFSLQLSVETSYRGISSYHNNRMFLTKSAMNELASHLSFTQLRFHCSKQHGRTFHVITATNTSGEAVVQYFSGQTDVRPDACGSFVKMEDDNSKLTEVCQKWGSTNSNLHGINKWSGARDEDRLYKHVVLVWYKYHWHLAPEDKRLECDDHAGGVSSGDFWKIYVR